MSETDLFNTALNKAMALCSKQEQCCQDILNKLKTWSINTVDSEKIIEILLKENFINETRYAAAFVKDKFKYNKWGKVKIASHLKSKKIPQEIISSSMHIIDNDLYTKSLRQLIENHRRTIKFKSNYDLKAKLLRYGLSKGFESDLLYDILNDLDN
jgi:regulatory protein